jgi:hypothetical protein
MSLSLYLTLREQWAKLACVGVLLFLSRVDTGIWLLVLGSHILLSRRRRTLRELAVPVAIFLTGIFCWLAFTKLYYGSVVPQSVVGKAVSHGAFQRPDVAYTVAFLSGFVPAQRFGSSGLAGLALIVVVLLLLLFPAADLWRRKPGLRPVLYFFPVYVAFFLASRAPLFSWYLLPPKWAFYLIVAYAVWCLGSRVVKFAHVRLDPAWTIMLAIALVFVLDVRNFGLRFAERKPPLFLEISDLIEQNVTPRGSIFLEHIGLVGFRTDRYIYDSMGLVTPATIRLRRQYGANWLTRSAREFHADVVVLYTPDLAFMQSPSEADAVWFQNSYAQVADYHLPEFDVLVFFLRDSPNVAWNNIPQALGSRFSTK